jgi:hypothetical protein
MVVVMQAVLQPTQARPRKRRHVKGETVHAIFAQGSGSKTFRAPLSFAGIDAPHLEGS